jgi:exodeoxyribonuclease VII large subunit
VDNLEWRLQQTMLYKYSGIRERAQHSINNLHRFAPFNLIRTLQEKVNNLQQRLYQQEQNYLKGQRIQLAALAGRLDSLSPLSVLRRGYSICRKLPAFQIITDANSLGPQDLVNVKLLQGEIICEVKSRE